MANDEVNHLERSESAKPVTKHLIGARKSVTAATLAFDASGKIDQTILHHLKANMGVQYSDFLTEDAIAEMLRSSLRQHSLTSSGWDFRIEDSIRGLGGYTDFDRKLILLSRDYWPTSNENIAELVRHEVAHAIRGVGDHDREWWDILVSIGGHGIWISDEGEEIRVIVEP